MDGYAVVASDVVTAVGDGTSLRVAAEVYAKRGCPAHFSGTATAVATGAPLPIGADAVIPFEQIERQGDRLWPNGVVAPGDHIFPTGEDAKTGDVLVPVGQRLHAGKLALLASAGIDMVAVFRRPRIAILCTGDELVPIHTSPEHGQIRNSNGPMLSALVEECGGDVVQCDVVKDEPAAIIAALSEAFDTSDLIVTTGGASSGPRDFVKASLASLETEFFFRSVAMRPGRPMALGVRHAASVAVLPGNPAAAFVGFVEIVRPALLRLGGLRETRLPRITAKLHDSIARSKLDRSSFLFAKATFEANGSIPLVRLLSNQCSSLTRTAASSNCLVCLPPSANVHSPGDTIDVDILPWTI
jgi:molybdopterin molybdotransferase